VVASQGAIIFEYKVPWRVVGEGREGDQGQGKLSMCQACPHRCSILNPRP
jgi:hypothetical protein